MKITALAVSVLALAAAFAGAHGGGAHGRSFGRHGSSSQGRFSGQGGSPRALSRPTFAHATNTGAASRTGFVAASSANGRYTFANAAKAAGAGTAAGGERGSPTPGTANAPPPYAAVGARILTAGQQPVYSNPGNAGTSSVNGGGFIAIDQSHAVDAERGPGITWGAPGRPPSSSAGGGSGASSNGPAFDPSF